MDNVLVDNVLLQELLLANDPEEKAAIVAESIFEMLPRETSLVARRCSILHWFSEIIIEALLKDRPYIEGQFRGIYDQIKALPFLEVLPLGLTFNSLTREGLLRRYTITQPEMLRTAAQLAAPSYKALGGDEKIAAEAIFCYFIAGKTTLALELLNELMRKAYANGNWEFMNGLVQVAHEAHEFSFVNPLPLSEILEPYASHLKFDSFSYSPTEMSDIDLVRNIRARKEEGDNEGVSMLCKALLERCAPEFQRRTLGLQHRPELREEAIANMINQLLREVLDPKEIFITQNFIHYLRCLCADEFTKVLRQEGLHYRRDKDGRLSGRPQHVPRGLIEPLRFAPADDESFSEADVVASVESYEKLHDIAESERILIYLTDPLDRAIVAMRAIEGMKWDDIAAICKRTERTVRLRYERAQRYLKECISR